jgi:hypothetical protein
LSEDGECTALAEDQTELETLSRSRVGAIQAKGTRHAGNARPARDCGIDLHVDIVGFDWDSAVLERGGRDLVGDE